MSQVKKAKKLAADLFVELNNLDKLRCSCATGTGRRRKGRVDKLKNGIKLVLVHSIKTRDNSTK